MNYSLRSNNIRNLYRYIKANIYWIAETWPFWLCLFVIVISVCFTFLGGTSEQKIRMIGMFLQLFGVATVAWGVDKTRRFFGHPGFFQLVRSWSKRRPKYHLISITGKGQSSISLSQKGTSYEWHTTGPDTPPDKRLAAVEVNLFNLNARFDQTQKELDHVTSTINFHLDQERLLREREDQAIREKLEVAQTDGLWISIVGLVWLFLGVIMSSASDYLWMHIK